MTNILKDIQQGKQDAIIWRATTMFATAGLDPYKQGAVKTKVANLLALIRDEDIRSGYIDGLAKTFKGQLSKQELRKSVENVISKQDFFDGMDEGEDPWAKLPAFMDKEQLEESGFCAAQGDATIQGYWGYGKDGKIRITNFLILPIFHVYAKEESRHIFTVTNHRKEATLDVPSKVFSSVETFQNYLVGEGNFLIYGSRNQLLNISTKLLDHFPMCMEIKQLGWQPEGFFAFVNKIYIPGKGLQEITPAGIASIGDKNYLVPAASNVYKDMRAVDDPFENDRTIHYIKSKVSFGEWAGRMDKVYCEHGLVGVAYVLLTLFRDIVFAVDHNCPHLYGYGERSAGKSKWAESITAVFYIGRSAFQLNSGTDFAFFAYMQRFRNCIAHLNEFDDKVTKEEWFQSIKGIFDGEGRERGKMSTNGGSRNRTEVQRVDGTLILTGQFISTKDDNSVVSRSIICPFHERTFTDEERAAYDELKALEAGGLTSILVDVLEHRAMVKEKYYLTFSAILSAWRKNTTEQFNQRIFQNWCHLATMWKLFEDILQLPVSANNFAGYCLEEAVKYSRFIRDSDILSTFWNSVAFLRDQQLIHEDWDFKIVTKSSISLRDGEGKEFEKQFGTDKKLLIIRLKAVHALFQVEERKRTGKEAMSFENLKHYFSNRNYFIGQVKQQTFSRWIYKTIEKGSESPFGDATLTASSERRKEVSNTSAYVFDYDLLGCELEREDGTTQTPAENA